MKLDGKAFGEAIVDQVKAFVDRALGAIDGRVRALEERAAPADGKNGLNGSDGRDGKDGEPGRDGLDGKDGENGRDGSDGLNGQHGKDGDNGVGLASALIARDGQLVLTLTDGKTVALGIVVGGDGQDGKDGKDGQDGTNGERGADGFALNDFDTEMQADGRTLLLKFVRGDVTETHELKFPVMIYRGVFSEGAIYERGDVVTWGGAIWHCDAEPIEGEGPGKPVEGAKGWTLAVKRGRDGKAGENGKDGLKGRDGRDATTVPAW